MRLVMGFLVAVGLLMAAGCAAHREHRQVWVRIPPQERPAELASVLLFDARPAAYDAQEFASRSDWPSTRSFYSPGQVIFYNEWFVDYQGRNFGSAPDSYRRAESVRVGVGYR
jgi:hypothetical protein